MNIYNNTSFKTEVYYLQGLSNIYYFYDSVACCVHQKAAQAWHIYINNHIVLLIIKEYRMVFRAGLRDPCTRDVARLSESVKIHEP